MLPYILEALRIMTGINEGMMILKMHLLLMKEQKGF
jgi:hypothetical protein